MSKKNNMTIATVIVTYNRRYLLEECLNAVLNQQEWSCEAIVVDNASSDQTCEYMTQLSAENDRIHYYRLDSNIGGSGGFNYGMKKALQLGADYIWMMDDDCIPEPDALKELMIIDEYLGDFGGYGFLSSKVLWTDGTECVMNRQHKVSGGFEDKSRGVIQINQATFVSLFLPISSIKKYGLPIVDYFIWGDDIEFTRRIAVRRQQKSYLAEKSCVVHKMAANVGSNLALDKESNLQRYVYAFRNEQHLYSLEGIKGKLHYWLKCGYNAARILLIGRQNKTKRLRILFRGIAQGMKFNPPIEYSEDILQDKEIS